MRLAKRIGLAALALPACHFVVSTELDPDNAIALLTCLPRTARALHWAVRAGWDYYTHLHSYAETDWSALNCRWADSLTYVCRKNGGVYVKAAQMISTFGAFPDEYRSRLGQLHDQCAPKPFSKIHKSLRNELGKNYDEKFTEIDENATAAASIAQVHRARLMSGEHVAVKVQYPALEKAITADLHCLIFLSRISDYIFPNHQLNWVFVRLRQQVFEETDFTIEARNAQNLERKLKHRRDIRVPRLYLDLCTSRLLVMEWIDGCKLSDRSCLRFHEMTLVHGFIHGDPHPGNLLVIPTPCVTSTQVPCMYTSHVHIFRQWRTPFQLVLLDHGRYLEMDDETRLDYCALWCSLVRGDQSSAIKAATKMCHGDSGGQLLPKILYRSFDRRTRRHLQSDMSISDVINILHTAPQTLVDALRIVAVVRHVAAALADIKSDRACIEGTRAWDGLLVEERTERDYQISWNVEIRVKLRLLFMRIAMWMRDASYSWTLFTGVLS